MFGLENYPGIKCQNIKPQVIAQLELWNERKSGKYENRSMFLPKHLDEKVAALHFPSLV
eukprot:jgi/Pico_ML_1/54253/g4628.t1